MTSKTPPMAPRIYVPVPLHSGLFFDLPPEAARHVQVLRLQPGQAVRLFCGDDLEWTAAITAIGRREVTAVVEASVAAPERELACAVTLALGMPANERMDSLIEKATELGVAAIQPLQCERSVLRLSGERAERRRAHWQAIAVAAAEQSGRVRLPRIFPVRHLTDWLASPPPGARHVLSFAPQAMPLADCPHSQAMCFLSGPEGGLSAKEEALACAAGFVPVSLGALTLRADTAPLAALAWVALGAAARGKL